MSNLRDKTYREKMKTCSHLLPDPGGEVVRECLEYIEELVEKLAIPQYRSIEDKIATVRVALSQTAISALSDREIGRQCAVSHTFVGKVRRSMEKE